MVSIPNQSAVRIMVPKFPGSRIESKINRGFSAIVCKDSENSLGRTTASEGEELESCEICFISFSLMSVPIDSNSWMNQSSSIAALPPSATQ